VTYTAAPTPPRGDWIESRGMLSGELNLVKRYRGYPWMVNHLGLCPDSSPTPRFLRVPERSGHDRLKSPSPWRHVPIHRGCRARRTGYGASHSESRAVPSCARYPLARGSRRRSAADGSGRQPLTDPYRRDPLTDGHEASGSKSMNAMRLNCAESGYT
jgi:hypothetical protein